MRISQNLIRPPKCGKEWSSFSMQIHRHFRLNRLRHFAGLLCLLVPVGTSLATSLATAAAQTPPSQDASALTQILGRLDRLEKQNSQLVDEIRALRNELALSRGRPEAAPPADIAESVDVQDRRIEELAQTKVESSQHLPVRITGMALFNAFLNSHSNGKLVTPV